MSELYRGRFWNRSCMVEWGHLDGKEALLRGDDPDWGLAQFCDVSVPESHGWHALPWDHFSEVVAIEWQEE